MKIEGYSILEKLYQRKMSAIYRATKETDGTSCILKVLEKKAANYFEAITGLKSEYQFLKQVGSGQVIKALDWVEDKDFALIVLEDIDGKALKDEIENNVIPVDRFMEPALQIATGLAAIHAQNIIHKDINPSNIIRNVVTGDLKIIDFNIASKFDVKVSYLGNPEKLQGTLLYISPEQTGRMNRKVDQRTDLYSLGVTFYEMLTGQIPFQLSDPMEIVYAHLARPPVPPHVFNPEIPEILSGIIMKLLAKNPEERYQSTVGLKHDLEKLDKKKGVDFRLGEKDFSGKLQIPEKLYGRQKEIEQLLDAYGQVSEGAKEIIMVTGYSGTGKTALVNEIHKPITKDRGYFINGKFDQLQRSIPYSAFIQALNQFCRLILTETEDVLARWKERILEAVGNLGKLLTDIIPQLDSVIGTQPDVPEVGGEEAKQRFNYVLQRFLHTVSSKEHPLVIFIDDLQWADLASLGLLQVMVEDKQSRHLLFIGAYRDNEVPATHPLTMTFEEIQKQKIPIHRIPVKNLSDQNVHDWLSDTLKMDSDSGRKLLAPLTDLIYQKTGGNAFFTIQFLKNLYEEDLLHFDFKKSKWTWDIAEIKKQNITDNVVELLIRKIQALPTGAQEVLKLGACIGNAFDLHTLSVISEKGEEELRESLEIALTDQLVYPTGGNVYKFIHDRIHQAAYTLIADKDKKPVHLQIGRMLVKTFGIVDTSTVSEEAEKNIFTIVNHLDMGIDLITGEEEKIRLARLNYEAAHNAKVSAAYTLGEEYVKTAVRLLPGDCWQTAPDLALTIHNEAIQLSYLCGKFDEMENFVEAAITYIPNILDKDAAYNHRMMSYIAQNKPHLAEDTLLEAYNSLGVSVPKKPGKPGIMGVLIRAHIMYKRMGEEGLKKLPPMSDPRTQLLLRLLVNGTTGIMHATQELLPYITGKTLMLTLKHGLAPETPFIFSLYGIIRNFMGDTSGAYQIGRICLDMLDKIPGTETVRPRVMVNICFYSLGWKEHFKEVAKRLRENHQYGMDVGDIEWGSYSISVHCMYLMRTDTNLYEMKDKLQSTYDTIVQLKQYLPSVLPSMEIPVVASLLGETDNPAQLDLDVDAILGNIQEGSKSFVLFESNIRRVFLAFMFEDLTNILEYIKEAETALSQLQSPLIFFKSDAYFHIPLAYLKLYSADPGKSENKKFPAKVKKSLNGLKKLAKLGPANFLHKYYLVQAELHRVTGKTRQAAEFYDKAIDTAYENDYVNEAALANELAAKFYLHDKLNKLATIYFMEARNCYRKWGAVGKVKDLEDKYPKFLSLGSIGSPVSTGIGSTSSADNIGERLDLHTILKATRTLSGEVQLKGLMEKMMQILIENAGAQKSMLIEKVGEHLFIQAEGNTFGVSGVLRALPVEESDEIPLSVINYVSHSKEKVVFDNISKDAKYSTDPYVQANKPKSVVCFPILSKGELSAIIYLENSLVEGGFTPERLEILNILSAQIAISVENTHLYEQLEEKVRQRTVALQRANEELERNHQELEESHRKINDSVNYASKIQHAVLPARESFEKILPRHFILYRPCSVVSGDFYWIKEVGNKIVVVAADCTGHGIPGALVSMLGMAFLNEIVPQLAAQSRLTAANILDELRRQVKIALQQKGKLREQRDGMDIALCIIDPVEKQMQFAGAYNPLYMICENRLTEVKGDRMPVGIYRKERPFTLHEMPFQGGEMIYLCTDGFIHQNSAEHEMFTRKRFKSLLLEINGKNVSEQQEALVKRFDQWKGDLLQRDDILILGVRL